MISQIINQVTKMSERFFKNSQEFSAAHKIMLQISYSYIANFCPPQSYEIQSGQVLH